MAVVDEIAVKLGISTAQFKAALKDADATVKSFKKGGEFGDNEGFGKSVQGMTKAVGQFRALLAGGGIIGLFKELFQKGAEYAEKHKNAIDDDVQAMLRLKEASEGFGDTAGKAFVALAGFMDTLGKKAGELVYGMEAVVDAFAAEEAARKKALAIEEQKRANELAKIRRDIAYEEADANGKILILVEENIKRQLELNKLKRDGKDTTKLQGEIEKANAEIRKQIAEEERATAQETKRQFDELKKIHEDNLKYAEDSVRLDKELAKIAFDKLTPEKQLAELKKEQARLQKEIKDSNADENEIKRDKVELDKVQKQILETKAKIQEQINKGVTQELTEEQKVTAELKRQTEEARKKADQAARYVALTRTNRIENTDLTDRQLAERIANLRKQEADANAMRQNGNIVYIDTQEREQAEQEQQLRARFRQLAAQLGTEGALQQFSAFDEDRLRALVEGRNAQKETVDALKDIKEHIRNAFPMN